MVFIDPLHVQIELEHFINSMSFIKKSDIFFHKKKINEEKEIFFIIW